jgi:hypothetical protein
MKRALLFLLVLFLVSFSGHTALQANQETGDQGTPVPVTQLGPKRSGPRWSFTSNSGISDRLRMVIRDREAWLDVWKRIHSPGPTHGPSSTVPPLPEIDFSREMLIVVTSGARPTGGYGIIVDAAYERHDQFEIVVRTISPGKGCFVTQAVTQPVDIVRLPKTERSVVFREIEVVQECK